MQSSCADVNSPYKRKCWINSGGSLVNSVLGGSCSFNLYSKRRKTLIKCRFYLVVSGRDWRGRGSGSATSSFLPKQRVLTDLYRTRLSCGRMIQLLAPPPFRQQVVYLFPYSCVSPVKLTNGSWPIGWEGKCKWGAKSYDHQKAWSSIIHSILSVWNVSSVLQ